MKPCIVPSPPPLSFEELYVNPRTFAMRTHSFGLFFEDDSAFSGVLPVNVRKRRVDFLDGPLFISGDSFGSGQARPARNIKARWSPRPARGSDTREEWTPGNLFRGRFPFRSRK